MQIRDIMKIMRRDMDKAKGSPIPFETKLTPLTSTI